jgi:hypothetical protein
MTPDLTHLTAECERLKGELAQAKINFEGAVKGSFGSTEVMAKENAWLREELTQAKTHNAALLEACEAGLPRLIELRNFYINRQGHAHTGDFAGAIQQLRAAIAGKGEPDDRLLVAPEGHALLSKATLALLEKDKARLDWLERHAQISAFINGRKVFDSFGERMMTHRAAIDSAIALEKGEK